MLLSKRSAALWAVVFALIGAVALYGELRGRLTGEASAASAYTCPVTGQELPCPMCCPLNQTR